MSINQKMQLKHDLIWHIALTSPGDHRGYMNRGKGRSQRKATEKFHLINSQKNCSAEAAAAATSPSRGTRSPVHCPSIHSRATSERAKSQCPRSRESLTFLFQLHPHPSTALAGWLLCACCAVLLTRCFACLQQWITRARANTVLIAYYGNIAGKLNVVLKRLL